MVEGLSKTAGAKVHIPEGTFFTFVDMQAFGLDSLELAVHLLKEGRVITVPGTSYGTLGQGHIRLSFASSAEDIEMGLERIRKALECLSHRPQGV